MRLVTTIPTLAIQAAPHPPPVLAWRKIVTPAFSATTPDAASFATAKYSACTISKRCCPGHDARHNQHHSLCRCSASPPVGRCCSPHFELGRPPLQGRPASTPLSKLYLPSKGKNRAAERPPSLASAENTPAAQRHPAPRACPCRPQIRLSHDVMPRALLPRRRQDGKTAVHAMHSSDDQRGNAPSRLSLRHKVALGSRRRSSNTHRRSQEVVCTPWSSSGGAAAGPSGGRPIPRLPACAVSNRHDQPQIPPAHPFYAVLESPCGLAAPFSPGSSPTPST